MAEKMKRKKRQRLSGRVGRENFYATLFAIYLFFDHLVYFLTFTLLYIFFLCVYVLFENYFWTSDRILGKIP